MLNKIVISVERRRLQFYITKMERGRRHTRTINAYSRIYPCKTACTQIIFYIHSAFEHCCKK